MRSTAPITFRIHKDALKALDTVRSRDTRTRSMQILHYVLQGLMSDGFKMTELDPRKTSHE